MSWVSSLYFAEALPYSAVMLLSVLLFKDMGLDDAHIALYTSWLSLPWVIKPLWSTVVDNLRTKRWWIVTMQTLMGAALASVALTLPTDLWLQLSLCVFMLVAFSSATHDIAADGFYILGLSPKDQELYVGWRNTFYRIGIVVAQGGLVVLQQWGVSTLGYSQLEAWRFVFVVFGALMGMLALCHHLILPHVEETRHDSFSISVQLRELVETLKFFFTKPAIVSSLCFILFYRLPEGLLTKMVPLFLTRSVQEGGVGLTNGEFGFIYGTLGVVGLLLGGILGGWAVSRWGLRRCIWPLVLSITVPDLAYVYLSLAPESSLHLVGALVCVEQLGYGLGFAAYTLFLVTFSRGERATAVFSICTAVQYLGGIMLPGMVSGFLSTYFGYTAFFCIVMLCCLVTFAVTAAVYRNLKA